MDAKWKLQNQQEKDAMALLKWDVARVAKESPESIAAALIEYHKQQIMTRPKFRLPTVKDKEQMLRLPCFQHFWNIPRLRTPAKLMSKTPTLMRLPSDSELTLSSPKYVPSKTPPNSPVHTISPTCKQPSSPLSPLPSPTRSAPTPAVTPVVSLPVVKTPKVATPVVATPVVATPVVATPVVATPVAPVALTPVAPIIAAPVAPLLSVAQTPLPTAAPAVRFLPSPIQVEFDNPVVVGPIQNLKLMETCRKYREQLHMLQARRAQIDIFLAEPQKRDETELDVLHLSLQRTSAHIHTTIQQINQLSDRIESTLTSKRAIYNLRDVEDQDAQTLKLNSTLLQQINDLTVCLENFKDLQAKA
jgi:hypothetical protein